MPMEERIIPAKFSQWTSGLGPKEARVSVFEHIRDIPYAIVPELRDPVRGPSGILKTGKGSCQPKHYLLGRLFTNLDIPVKYITFPFKWSDCGIKFPPDIKEIAAKLPPAYHLACRAYINNKWVLVDATYDIPLKKGGFTVNESWDGESDTLNAVNPIKEVIHKTVEDRVMYETGQRALYTEEEKALYTEFIDKLNTWMDGLRKTKPVPKF